MYLHQHAHTALAKQTHFVCLFAGHMDVDTREWTDGVLTAAARAVAKERLDKQSWIVCDGDVDPEWIESLNSVLDDNRQTSLCTLVALLASNTTGNTLQWCITASIKL